MDRIAPETVLIAAPSAGLRWALTRLLSRQCPAVQIAEVDDEYRMLRALVEAPPDVVVMWGSFLAGDRARALQSLRVITPATRWILITATPAPHDSPGVHTVAASDIDRLPELLRGGAGGSSMSRVGGPGGVGSDLGGSTRDGHGQGDAAARAG
jgi:response regulator RpfG family c-di-GMP phosphodiesterase